MLKAKKSDHWELEEQSYQAYLEKAKVVLEEILSQFREPFLVSVSTFPANTHSLNYFQNTTCTGKNRTSRILQG